MVSGGEGEGRVLLRGPPEAVGGSAIELGRHDGWVLALAVLLDGRVVSGGSDGRVLLWDTAGSQPVELGRHDHPHAHSGRAVVAVLWDGRVVSGGADGRVLLWDVAEAGSEAVELYRHEGWVAALAELPDGRMVSAGADGRVRLWDVTTQSEIAQLGCSSTALAAGHRDRDGPSMVIVHAGTGLSFWSVAGATTK